MNPISGAPSLPAATRSDAAVDRYLRTPPWSGLADASGQIGVVLDAEALARFARYRDLLLHRNAQFNLTAVRDPIEIERRLILDALAMFPAIDRVTGAQPHGINDSAHRQKHRVTPSDRVIPRNEESRLKTRTHAKCETHSASPQPPDTMNACHSGGGGISSQVANVREHRRDSSYLGMTHFGGHGAQDVSGSGELFFVRLVDVGAGAGFPGLVLKIARPSLDVTLIDATAKKVAFLNEVITDLGLHNLRAVHGRAEDLGQDHQFRERFDLATARAVAGLPVLLEYVIPFLKVGGTALLPKGLEISEELRAGTRAAAMLGAAIVSAEPLPVGGTRLVIAAKTKPTLAAYPRGAGTPSRNPLGEGI